jgi:hypothetical protein
MLKVSHIEGKAERAMAYLKEIGRVLSLAKQTAVLRPFFAWHILPRPKIAAKTRFVTASATGFTSQTAPGRLAHGAARPWR